LCRKLKTISVEIRRGNGNIRYTYQTTKWPKCVEVDNGVYVQDALNNFQPQRTLERIFRGNLSLCAMQKYENRTIWKLIFDNIDHEDEL
jgi:hypothetical protein